LSGSIGKTVLESGTKIGQSGPVKSFSSTAEAISAQIESEQSLNSQVSFFCYTLLFNIFIITFFLGLQSTESFKEKIRFG